LTICEEVPIDTEQLTMVYLPPLTEEHDLDRIHACIRDFPFATLITIGADGLVADHIPFILDPRAGEHGTLIGHVARNNDVWRPGRHDGEALAVFQSAEAYVSPNWYPGKAETHRAVPTWNYAVVHAWGPLIVHDDPRWVRGAAGRLTKQMEASMPVPWKMADAPPEFIMAMLEQIVGIEIPITRLVGKWKISRTRSMADQLGAIDGLRTTGDAGDAAMADLMAGLIESRQS
jgi:transcriptional regulator